MWCPTCKILIDILEFLTYNTNPSRQCIQEKHPSWEWLTNRSCNLNSLKSLETANYTRNWKWSEPMSEKQKTSNSRTKKQQQKAKAKHIFCGKRRFIVCDYVHSNINIYLSCYERGKVRISGFSTKLSRKTKRQVGMG